MRLRTVLVVDDDPASLLLARASLELGGHLQVATECDGAAAVARAIREVPDVILMDVAMPDVDGLQALAALRANPATSAIPVVFLTGYAAAHEADALVAAGAVGVILKPFHAVELAALVHRVVERADRERTGPFARGSVLIPDRSPEDAVVGLAAVDDDASPPLAARRRILVIDHDLACSQMIHRALRRFHEVVVANSAPEALRWIRAGHRFDLILCELALPTLSGADLFAMLSTEHAEQSRRVAFITAPPPTSSDELLLDTMTGRVLWKPFDHNGLVTFVAAHLTATEPCDELGATDRSG